MEEARVEAELLLAHTLGTDRFKLYIDDFKGQVPHEKEELYSEFLKRRLAGEPLAYIVGEKEFWSRSFKVGKGCLIPRPETELVVEEALRLLSDHLSTRPRILDLGTGSGCIGITLALELVQADKEIEPIVVASDISWEALAYARKNILLHKADRWVTPLLCDWMECFRKDSFELIVSNPPYIGDHEREFLQKELSFEPEEALFSGDEGLFHVKKLLEEAHSLMVKGGALVVELGIDHARRLMDEGQYLLERYESYWISRDIQGIERVIVLKR